MQKNLIRISFIIALIATLGSLYYWWFWDPFVNIKTGELFLRSNGYEPCEMCRFARILMYPIVAITWVWLFKKYFDYVSVLILSGLWIILEAYQYRYQMSHSADQINSFICNWWNSASCAAVEVMYLWFITIPFLCLVAFIGIFVTTLIYMYNKKNKNNTEETN